MTDSGGTAPVSSASERTTGSSSSTARLSLTITTSGRAVARCSKRVEESFAGGSESGDTYPPRAALDLGYSTRKCGRLFHVREEFANEREDHAIDFSSAIARLAFQNSRCSRKPGTRHRPAVVVIAGIVDVLIVERKEQTPPDVSGVERFLDGFAAVVQCRRHPGEIPVRHPPDRSDGKRRFRWKRKTAPARSRLRCQRVPLA